MSWNAHQFCGGLEGILRSAFQAAGNARREAAIDRSGPTALARLARELRRERRRSTALQAELIQAYLRLRDAEADLARRPR